MFRDTVVITQAGKAYSYKCPNNKCCNYGYTLIENKSGAAENTAFSIKYVKPG